jgi:uncharacterized membrane protein
MTTRRRKKKDKDLDTLEKFKHLAKNNLNMQKSSFVIGLLNSEDKNIAKS